MKKINIKLRKKCLELCKNLQLLRQKKELLAAKVLLLMELVNKFECGEKVTFASIGISEMKTASIEQLEKAVESLYHSLCIKIEYANFDSEACKREIECLQKALGGN